MTTSPHYPWLTDQTGFDRFDAILKLSFDEPNYRFFSLRTNSARIESAVEHLLAHASPNPGKLLNVGAGAFVLDFVLGQARPWHIVSFDIDPGYISLYSALRQQGLLAHTSFMLADLRHCEFAPQSFQFILAHDLLFVPSLDLSWVLPKFARWLQPEGFLYFDVWDQRMRSLWRLSRKYHLFKRYDLRQVRQLLENNDFRVIVEKPYFGSRAFLREVRKMLWTLGRLSNTRHFLVQRCA